MKSKYYTFKKNENGSYDLTIKQTPILYQYRSVNSYTVKALMNSEIWATVPTAFNDPYDSAFCFRELVFKQSIRKHINAQNMSIYADLLFGENKKGKYRVSDIVDQIYLRYFHDSISKTREMFCVSCFSEVYDSEIMWAHYAGNATGFQVEYDGQQLKSLADNHRNQFMNVAKSINVAGIDLSSYPEPNYVSLFPVIYTGLKPNHESTISKVIDPLFTYFEKCINGDDVIDATNAYLTTIINSTQGDDKLRDRTHTLLCSKQKAWSYEKEWRIWSYNMNPLIGQMLDKHVYLGKVKPLAICLGEYISKYDEIALVEIAKTVLDIPVYKMKTQINRNSMKLVPHQIY